jgi:hypothetical protein
MLAATTAFAALKRHTDVHLWSNDTSENSTSTQVVNSSLVDAHSGARGLVLAVIALVGFFLQSELPWVGLSQRIFVGTITLWLVLVAFRIRSLAKAASAEQPPRVP